MTNNNFEHPSSGRKVSYATVRRAMEKSADTEFQRRYYSMSLASQDEIQAVINCVNHGIDSHLEACYVPDRGDKFETVEHKLPNGKIYKTSLDCVLSAESLPVLLRRLSEIEFEDGNEAGSLVAAILQTIGIDEYGKFVGRKAVGST